MVEKTNQKGKIRVDFTNISDEIMTSERIDHIQVKLIPPFLPPKGSRIPFRRPKAYTTNKMPFEIPIDLPYGYTFKVQARAHNTKGYGQWSHSSTITIGQEICIPAEVDIIPEPEPEEDKKDEKEKENKKKTKPRGNAIFSLEVGGKEYTPGEKLEISKGNPVQFKIKNIGTGGIVNWALLPAGKDLLTVNKTDGLLKVYQEQLIKISFNEDKFAELIEDLEGDRLEAAKKRIQENLRVTVIVKTGKGDKGWKNLFFSKTLKFKGKLYFNLKTGKDGWEL